MYQKRHKMLVTVHVYYTIALAPISSILVRH